MACKFFLHFIVRTRFSPFLHPIVDVWILYFGFSFFFFTRFRSIIHAFQLVRRITCTRRIKIGWMMVWLCTMFRHIVRRVESYARILCEARLHTSIKITRWSYARARASACSLVNLPMPSTSDMPRATWCYTHTYSNDEQKPNYHAFISLGPFCNITIIVVASYGISRLNPKYSSYPI